MTIPTLMRHPFFLVGLLLRVGLIVCVLPWTHTEWFLPFLAGLSQAPSLDPWTAHLATGGSPLAFPYGPVMLLAFLPAALLAYIVPGVLGVAFGGVTLAFDVLLMHALQRILSLGERQLLLLYWLSPIVLYVCYWHGQIDVVPVALLALALAEARTRSSTKAGVFLGLAVSAKFSMVLAAPFIVMYLWQNPRYRAGLISFLQGLAATVAVLHLPAILSPGFRSMVFGSPEILKVYNVAIDLGGGARIYLVPILYLLALYGAWRVQRMSFDLLVALMGIGFFIILLLTPASSGWYLWGVPFLIAFQARTGTVSLWLGSAFSVLYVCTAFLFSSGSAVPLLGIMSGAPLLASAPPYDHLRSLLLTGSSALLILIAVRMAILGIRRSDYFRLSRRPLVLGIAGDSGSGKDTLALAVAGLFGGESVTHVCGDDYHKWDRHAPMWQALTHLDPRANNLHQFASDVTALLDGKAITCRRYDHEHGVFSRGVRMKRNDCIIVSGLHVLYVPEVRRQLDLSIFLAMDDGLRQQLKVNRDVHERQRDEGAVRASIERRRPDAEQFIQPQSEQADLVFSLQPAEGVSDAESIAQSRYRLHVHLRQGLHYEDLVRSLIALCGLQVDYAIDGRSGSAEMTIQGDVAAGDIALAAQDTMTKMEELVSESPRWMDGMLGIMQLVTLRQMYDSLTARMVYGPRFA